MDILENHFIGEGGTKLVYSHPSDNNICIKFPRKKRRALTGLLREIKYLKKHQDNLPFLSAYLGKVTCNLGVGYMYQMAKNEDGSPAKDISHSKDTLPTHELHQKVSSIYSQLIKQHAVINDLNLGNIYVKHKLDGGFELILVDGFGNNNFIKIGDYSKYFLVKKLNRKFEKLCRRLNISSDFLIP